MSQKLAHGTVTFPADLTVAILFNVDKADFNKLWLPDKKYITFWSWFQEVKNFKIRCSFFSIY